MKKTNIIESRASLGVWGVIVLLMGLLLSTCEPAGAGDKTGGTDRGGTDQEGTDQGGTDQGGTDQEGADQGGTDQGGTDQGGTDQGEADQGGTDQGGADQGGVGTGGGGAPRQTQCDEMITAANAYNILQDNNRNNFKLDGNYCLAEDITVQAFATIWRERFTGSLDGKGHTMTITFPDSSFMGVFRSIGSSGVIYNLKLDLQNGDRISLSNSNYSSATRGFIAMSNFGTIENVGVTSSHHFVGQLSENFGGLVGTNTGTIKNCFSTVNITGIIAGGLAGHNSGTISYSIATGDIKSTTTGSAIRIGGLVGSNNEKIFYSLATGDVNASAANAIAGGLVGVGSGASVVVEKSASLGGVMGTIKGGLIGQIDASTTITDSFFNSMAFTAAVAIGDDGDGNAAMTTQPTGASGIDLANLAAETEFLAIFDNAGWDASFWSAHTKAGGSLNSLPEPIKTRISN